MTTSPKNEANRGLHETYKFSFMKNEMKFCSLIYVLPHKGLTDLYIFSLFGIYSHVVVIQEMQPLLDMEDVLLRLLS